jgi:AcrR family transcriptional regulator
MTQSVVPSARRTQAERRSRTRSALLEAAAREFSTYGYANASLERVAREAGYTRGALYHQFAGKEELALAVVAWVDETWTAEVGALGSDETDPVEALLAMAWGHAVYCRREVARVMMTLRVEFTGQDHPVGRAIEDALGPLEVECAALITDGRASGVIPPGPPAREVASAYLVVLEAVGIEFAGRPPYDVELALRAVHGVLGLPPAAATETKGTGS